MSLDAFRPTLYIMDRTTTTAAATVINSTVRLLAGQSSSTPSEHKSDRMTTAAGDEQVRVLGVDEYREAALSLADSFKDDEVSRYFIDTPDRAYWTEAQKWELHCQVMEYITHAHCLTGLVTTIGANYGCVALW